MAAVMPCTLQVDKKFIMMVCGSTLVALDQHAADERVGLEALQAQLQQRDAQRDLLLSKAPLRPQQVSCAVQQAPAGVHSHSITHSCHALRTQHSIESLCAAL